MPDLSAVRDVDVLVVGAGPAGLLAGARLGERYTVEIIDRAALGRSTKYWVTTERRLARHALTDSIRYRSDTLVVGTYLGGEVRGTGDLAVVDDEHVLHTLLDRCRQRGVILTEHCTLLNLTQTDRRMLAETSTGSYRARLIVDATGGMSPVADTFRLHRLDGFYAVHGALLRPVRLAIPHIVVAWTYRLGHPPPMLEVVPCGPDSAYCAVFTYARRLADPRRLATIFQEHCRRNPFFSTTAATKTVAPKFGAIPIGTLRTRRLAGVVSIGEAALVHPPLLATAFNEILEYSDEVSAHLDHHLASGDGVVTVPPYRYPFRKRLQDRLQLLIMRRLLRGNVESFDRLVQLLALLPPPVVFALCSSELTSRDVWLAVRRLPHLLRPWRHLIG